MSVFTLVTLWLAMTASAQDVPEAPPSSEAAAEQAPTEEEVLERYRDLARRAIDEFDARNFDEALALFDQAYALRPTARVLRGIGKVRFEQRQYVRALEAFEGALTASLDPLSDTMRAEVTELRDRALGYVGELSIAVEPAGAQVTVDGRELAPDTVFPIRLDMGAHIVAASSPGRQSAHRTIDIAGGRATSVRIELLETGTSDVIIIQQSRDTTGAWVMAGIGVALLGATVGTAVWMGNRLDAASACASGEARGLTCATEASIASERDAAIGTVAASAVLTAAAIVTFAVLLADSGGGESASVALGCGADPHTAECRLRGTF